MPSVIGLVYAGIFSVTFICYLEYSCGSDPVNIIYGSFEYSVDGIGYLKKGFWPYFEIFCNDLLSQIYL